MYLQKKKKSVLDVLLRSWEFIKPCSQFATCKLAWNVLFLGKGTQKAKKWTASSGQRKGKSPGKTEECFWSLFAAHATKTSKQISHLAFLSHLPNSTASGCQPLSWFSTAQALSFLPELFFFTAVPFTSTSSRFVSLPNPFIISPFHFTKEDLVQGPLKSFHWFQWALNWSQCFCFLQASSAASHSTFLVFMQSSFLSLFVQQCNMPQKPLSCSLHIGDDEQSAHVQEELGKELASLHKILGWHYNLPKGCTFSI